MKVTEIKKVRRTRAHSSTTHNDSSITPIEEIINNDGKPLKRHRRYRRGGSEISHKDMEGNLKAALILTSGTPVLSCFSDAVKQWGVK
jgi:hypothetical protein